MESLPLISLFLQCTSWRPDGQSVSLCKTVNVWRRTDSPAFRWNLCAIALLLLNKAECVFQKDNVSADAAVLIMMNALGRNCQNGCFFGLIFLTTVVQHRILLAPHMTHLKNTKQNEKKKKKIHNSLK